MCSKVSARSSFSRRYEKHKGIKRFMLFKGHHNSFRPALVLNEVLASSPHLQKILHAEYCDMAMY